MVGINPDYDFLYDPQQAKTLCFCSCCGGEIYRSDTEICDDCIKELQHGDEE
jgi:predicted amidophosphoribosyltransferase